jgi:hypothetical protein
MRLVSTMDPSHLILHTSKRWDFRMRSLFLGILRKEFTYWTDIIACIVLYVCLVSFCYDTLVLMTNCPQKTLRTWVRQVDQGTPTDQPASHMLHCLDALRQDVQCYADDTPRYTGFQEPGRSGTHQIRKCRDWNQMETWAQQHTACWRYMPELEREGRSILEEFRYCPEGSPYKETMERYFTSVG